MTPQRKIKRALISVYDKTGLLEFARALVNEFGIEIISTGGTAKHLKENGIPVTMVEEITGFPEMLDGRVKTLHPKIHAGILADRDNPEHMRQLEAHGIKPIDMVVVNLYPFEKTVADPNCTFEQAIEMIDIGGPCMLRAAAKNHKHVLVHCGYMHFNFLLKTLRSEQQSDWDFERMSQAVLAYAATARYDAKVSSWLSEKLNPNALSVLLDLLSYGKLRYGENPHQSAHVFGFHGRFVKEASVLCNVEDSPEPAVSYNNFVDAQAAMELCKDLSRLPSVAPTFQSVPSGLSRSRFTRRNLPHIQIPDRHYFVTFRIKSGQLSPGEKTIVLDACKHWHGEKMTLHACVVMPDHVHLLITPHETGPGNWVELGEITKSIKGHSAREINKLRDKTGSIWLDESWDRFMRDEKEFGETWDYIEDNPVKAGLGRNYEWVFLNRNSWEDLAAYYENPRGHRLESRCHNALPTCIFVKHTNACGVAVDGDPIIAYKKAYLGDPNAAMGGILACNFEIDVDFASAVMDTYPTWGKDAGAGGFFLEVWVAPEFEDDVISVIRSSKPWGQRVRLLSVGDMTTEPDATELEFKSITAGMLGQTRDLVGLNEDQWKVVTKRKPTESEMSDVRLAWLVAKHTKSNAISICKDGMLIGNGAGQMSRVMSCRIATWLAKENRHEDKLKGSVAASDAFFPFPDGPTILMDAGVSAIIQPGGSKNDDKVIAACDERNVAMIFTGTRHFKH